MPKELHAKSYELTFEKLVALLLGAVNLWLCFGNVARGYGFFSDIFAVLKLGVCILSCFLCIRVFSKGVIGPAVVCGLIAVIYNPFFMLDLDYDSWRAVNFVTAIAFAWIVWRFHKVSQIMTPELIENIRKIEAKASLRRARADLIDEAIDKGEFDESVINEFMSKLTGAGDDQNTKPLLPATTPVSKTEAIKREWCHFVIKGPPPGVPQTKQNTIATAMVTIIYEPDGTYKTTTNIYSKSDPLTIIEASSVIYWRGQIESGFLTDQQAIDGLDAIQQHTPLNYIILESIDSHPGEVSITSGLAQLSLHYAIAYLPQLIFHHPAVRWMADQQVKGATSERANDFKEAEKLKNALTHADVTAEFLTHLKASVAGSKE